MRERTMIRKNGIFYMVTAVLLALTVLCVMVSESAQEPYLKAELSSGGQRETIQLWEDPEGNVFVFLPAYGEMEQLQLRTNAKNTYFLNGAAVADGLSCESFLLNQAYDFRNQGQEKCLTFVRSEGVPAMYINTRSGSMDKIHEDRANEEPGNYHLYSEEGHLLSGGSLSSIKGRGNATWWSHDKKPYSISLAAEADLLGMGRAGNWVLLANASEHSHVKNKAVLELAQKAGLTYTPQCRWVDLYLNGSYAGLYLLSERNEIHPNRVDIPADQGTLVSMELESRLTDRSRHYIKTEAGQALRVHQSALDDSALLKLWQSAENAILAEDGIDPVTGKNWQELIDLDSWARKYLLEEIFANVDACSISQFFYTDGTGRIYAGPAWDYDVTMISWEPNCLFGIRHQAWEGKPTPWFLALYQKDAFYNRVVQLYETVYRPLVQQLLDTGMQDYADKVAPAAEMNLLRWQGVDQMEYLEQAKAYMTKRLALLDSLWLEEEDHCFVYVNPGEFDNGAVYVIHPGEALQKLPEPIYPEHFGWYDRNTGEPYEPGDPIFEDTEIFLDYVKVENEPWVPPVPEEYPEPLSLMRLGPLLLMLLLLTVLAAGDWLIQRKHLQKTDSQRVKQPNH